MLLIYLSCIWVAGIWLGTAWELPPLLALLTLAPLPLLFFTRRRRPLLLATLGIFLFVAAAVYSYGSLYGVDDTKVRYYNDGGTVVVEGMVAADPDERDRSTRLTLAAARIGRDDGWHEVGGDVLVFVPRYPAYAYGDVLRVVGELETPPALDGFDYRGYLAHQGIYSIIYYPQIEVLETGRGFPPLAWIYTLRGHLADSLAGVLPEPQAALAQGIILGMRGNIPADVREDFARSGTSHLLAISGLHLGIMAGIFLGLGLWLFGRRRYLYVWLALAAVWGYAVITGMNPPVVRGAIMASLFLVAEALGRQRSAITALTVAAAVMVGISPYILGDAAFQLSFLAMAGLIFISPVLRDWGRRVTARLGETGALTAGANFTVDALSVTLGAVLAVWPVVAYYFGYVSLVGPLATFLALPMLPGIIVAGGLAALLFLAVPVVGQAVGWLAWLFLSYFLAVVGGLGAPAAASVAVDAVHPAFIWGYYIVLAALIWWRGRSRRRRLIAGVSGLFRGGGKVLFPWRKWLIAPLLIGAVLVTSGAAALPDDDLRVSFLDCGEGDAVLIQRGSRQVLVDGGPGPEAVMNELGRLMPFWDRSLDLVVLTHPHADHLGGLVEVLRRYRVEQVLAPDIPSEASLYAEWQRLIGEKAIPVTVAQTGQRIDLGGGVVIEVLGPPLELLTGTDSDTDNNGVVLRLVCGEVSFLFTADIMAGAEWELLRGRVDIAADVLKVAHHGSATSTTAAFLEVAGPQVAVISCGEGNRFGHPDEAVIDRLGEYISPDYIYRTDERGSIDFVTDGQTLRVETAR